MNQKITISQAIQYVCIGLALLLFFSIWPLGLMKQQSVSKSDEVFLEESGPVSVENNMTQMFIAEGPILKAIDLYVSNDMAGQLMTFRLYDSGYIQLWETFYHIPDHTKLPGFVHIPIGMEMEEGWEYYYTIEGISTDLYVTLEDNNASTSFANGTLLYGGEEIPGENIISRYCYSEPFSWWQIILTLVVLLGILYGVHQVCKKLLQEKGKDREITVQLLLQCICNPIILLVTVLLLWMVFPGRRFETGVVYYAFYYFGILSLAGFLLYLVNARREGEAPFLTVEIIKSKLPGLLMAVCFAELLWYCAEYMNGLYDIHHLFSTCRILIWFALAMLCMLRKQDWIRIWNGIYLVLALVGAYFYNKPYKGMEETEALYQLQTYVWMLGGFILLQTVIKLLQTIKDPRQLAKLRKPSLLASITTILLYGLLIAFRNGRTWMVIAGVIFAFFYLWIWLFQQEEKLLQNLSNGILLHFLGTVVYCLLHRPYNRYIFNRYGMMYHTVTMTGYHLALVLCGLLICLLVKYYRYKKWKYCLKELLFLGVAHSYLYFTLSRTGILAAVLMEVFVILFASLIYENKKVVGILRFAGILILVSVLTFPMTFTFQRIMPAIANDPIYSEIEETGYQVKQNEAYNSDKYMDVITQLHLGGYKLFGFYKYQFGAIDPMEQPLWKDVKELVLASTQPVYVKDSSLLVASEEADLIAGKEDFTNGRLDIFREYIKAWNATGHEEMGVPMPNGEISTHAHNTFLQVIHDFGLLGGGYFICFGVLVLAYGCITCVKRKNPYDLFLVALVVAFAGAGLAEWVFHLCNPMGMTLLLALGAFLFQKREEE